MPLVADWVMTQFLSVGMVTSGDPFVKPLKTNPPGPYDHQTFRISLKELLCLLGVGCHLFQSKYSPSLTVLLFNMGRTEKLNLPLAAFGQGPRMAPGIVFDFFIFPYGAVTSGGSQIDCMYLQNVCKLGDNFTRKFISVSPGSSYFKGLFYQKQGVSCFDLVPGHCTASCVLSPSNVCFKVVN